MVAIVIAYLMKAMSIFLALQTHQLLNYDEYRANKRIAEISRQIWGIAHTDYL